ncbi:MAG: hypothetical protein KC613_10420, partial [Myxococcales bacterium]|nr:hypothetical protein [Myxococcales bacterium]
MTPRYSLEQITLSGTPRAMGQAHGEALRDRIQAFVDVRFAAVAQYVADRGQGSIDGLLAIAAESRRISAAWHPEGVAEADGIAEGAGVDPVRLYAATNMTDMRDVLLLAGDPQAQTPPGDAEGCSSVMIPGARTATGHALVGQTWDLNPTDVDFIVGFHRKPAEGPETWGITCVGCLTLVAMNSHGVTVGTTNIKTWGARPGVGYLNLLHRAAHAPDAETAARWITDAPRAGAHTYWLADAAAQIELEAAPTRVVRRDTANGPVWRTNHCIDPQILAMQGEEPTPSTYHRFARIGALVDRQGFDEQALYSVFADRADGHLSVNRYH